MKTLFAKYKGLFITFLFFGVLIIMVPLAFGIGTADSGWKVDPGTVRTLTSGGSTQLTVVNTSTVSYFIPSRTAAELTAFINHRPIGTRVGYCGDGICDSNIGENACNGTGADTTIGTCPQDCGICGRVSGVVNSDNPWYSYLTGLGAVCGDGRCNSNLGESTLRCSQDCATNKGCCAVKNAYTNTSLMTDCSLYSTTVPSTTNSACSAKAGCKVFKRSDMSYSVCVRDLSYDQSKLSLGSSSYKTCADITDSSTCNGSNSCVWVGQADSPSCSNYCGSGHDGNKTDTFQTCPEEYARAGDGTDQCGGGVCDNDDISGENSSKLCPIDCGLINADGTAKTYSSGCGDGVCSSDELSSANGSSSECWRDCGYNSTTAGSDPRIDWGVCSSFSSICPTLNTSDKCLATNICSWSGSSCSLSSTNAMKTATNCSAAKNRIDCNRIACYWDKSAVNAVSHSCGDGICNISEIGGVATQETETNCPVDCRSAARGYYCQGPAICADKTIRDTCQAISGCQWVMAGTVTN